LAGAAAPRGRRRGSRSWFRDLRVSRKLMVVIAVHLLHAAVLLVVTAYGMKALSASRAYVEGEGLWSKAQKDAVYHLTDYAHSHENAAYNTYLNFLAVPLGDRIARLELEKPDRNLEVAKNGFVQGRNHPDDVHKMAMLFTRFRQIRYFDQAITIWAEADRYLLELQTLGEALHHKISTNTLTEAENRHFFGEIARINSLLTPIEDRFSETLGAASRWLQGLLIWVLVGVNCIILVLGLLISSSISRNIVRSIRRLQRSSEQVGAGDLTCSVKVDSKDELGQLASTFNTMIDDLGNNRLRLLQANRLAALGSIAGGIAHEINNPLAYLTTNLQFITEKISQTARSPALIDLKELSKAVDDAQDGAERVRKIVQDLKVFSRSDEETLTHVDIPTCLHQAIKMVANEINHRACLEVDCGPTPLIMANNARLGQVLVNLLINAAHAITEGQVEDNFIRVVTRHESGEGERVLIEIHDTGCGISPEIQSRIFEPFFTTKPVGIGTGLGLSISQQIIKNFGGDLWCTSEVGKGSCFSISLPVAATPAISVEKSGRMLPGKRGQILILDDEPMIGDSLHRLLAPEHDVESFASGKEALLYLGGKNQTPEKKALLQKNQTPEKNASPPRGAINQTPDVLLCDLMMQEMSGMDFYAELNRLRPELTSKVVFLSGGAFTAAAREFRETVPNLFLEKPVNVNELRAILRERVG
jgi:signal transduction histidine kinase